MPSKTNSKQNMANKPKPTNKKNAFFIQVYHPLKAIILADDFSNKFYSLSDSTPFALIPFNGVPLINYTINYLAENEVEEIIVCCKNFPDKIEKHVNSLNIKYNDTSNVTFKVIGSKGYSSIGDVLRDIESKHIIRSHFILIDKLIIPTNTPLKNLLQKHKMRCQKDKGFVMTAFNQKMGNALQNIKKHENLTIMWEKKTKKITFVEKRIEMKKYPEINDDDKDYVWQEWAQISEISICTPEVLTLFVDNFDFENVSDFIKGIVNNEEILGNSICIHQGKGECLGIDNFITFAATSQHLKIKNDSCLDNEYTQNDCVIQNSVVGSNCTIGKNVNITDSYVCDNVIIGDNCKLENCFVLKNVIIKNNVTLTPGCILFFNTIVGPNVSLPNCTVVQEQSIQSSYLIDSYDQPIGCQKTELDGTILGAEAKGYCFDSSETFDDEFAQYPDPPFGKVVEDVAKKFEIKESEDEEEDSEEELEDTQIFYNEAQEVLMRGIDEHILAENIIVEINSLKYAYNIHISDLHKLLFKAILLLPMKINKDLEESDYLPKVKKYLHYFFDVLKKYSREKEDQLNYLISLAQTALESELFRPYLTRILHLLYTEDLLTEEVIIPWYSNPPVVPEVESPEHDQIVKQMEPFINWLQQASEEDSSDED